MKKQASIALSICLLILCIATLSGCTKNAVSSKGFWDSVTDNETKQSISLGMSKEEIEKMFSTSELPAQNGEVSSVNVGEGKKSIHLTYQDNKVTEISVGGQLKQDHPIESNWSTHGISLGSTESDIIAAYGDVVKEENLNYPDGKILRYYFDKNGNSMDNDNQEETVSVNFWLENSKVIYFIIR